MILMDYGNILLRKTHIYLANPVWRLTFAVRK